MCRNTSFEEEPLNKRLFFMEKRISTYLSISLYL